VTIYHRNGDVIRLPKLAKLEVAHRILNSLKTLLETNRKPQCRQYAQPDHQKPKYRGETICGSGTLPSRQQEKASIKKIKQEAADRFWPRQWPCSC
jgi:hypothetical protein